MMRSNYVDFEYNNEPYRIHMSYDEVATIANLTHNNKSIIIVTRDSIGSRPAPAWKFESDFMILIRFIHDNKDTIIQYKKLYKANKKDTTVIDWFNKTPIADIDGISLDDFMNINIF